MLNESDVELLLSQFPAVEYAFAYGSGVVKQQGYDYSTAKTLPMLDLILVVEDSEKWHEENMLRNSSHYTSIIPLSAKYVAMFQEKLKANFWFNAYVPMNSPHYPGRLMKYGVISKKHILKDLNTWNNLYAAGRLHKPVHVLKTNDSLQSALELNREQAVRTSLLLLPEKFNEVDLYMTVASISYIGDPRMYVGENPKKVVNLVTPIVPHYQSLYQAAIAKMPQLERLNDQTFVQNPCQNHRWDMCLQLPSTLHKLLSIRARERYTKSTPPNAAAIRTALSAVVSSAATIQTMKGLFTVGMVKSTSYVAAKVAKRFLGA